MEAFDDVIMMEAALNTLSNYSKQRVSGGNGTSLCPEYFDTITKNLRTQEEKHRPSATYIENVQNDINSHMREILVDWLNEVTTEFHLKSESLCLAVNLVDRYLSVMAVPRSKLQLVGVVCMLIASKYEEVKPPTVDDFVYITDRTYSRQEVLTMEVAVLKALRFACTVTTVRDFVGIFLKAEEASEVACMLTDYLIELTLQDYGMVKYPPSIVVCAAVRLAQYTITTRPWSEALAYYSQRHPLEVAECTKELHRIWRHAQHNNLHAVRDKYANPRYRCVSTHYQPPAQVPV